MNSNNLLVLGPSRTEVIEYTPTGTVVQSLSIPAPHDSDALRGITVDGYGLVDVFDGTFYPSLARIDPANGAVEYLTYPSWSVTGTSTHGKIAGLGQYVFAQDEPTSGGGGASGLVRFDLAHHQTKRFVLPTEVLDLTATQDGNLFVLVSKYEPPNSATGARIDIYAPDTMKLVSSMDLPAIADQYTVAAVDKLGRIFLGSTSGYIYRVTTGVIDASYKARSYISDLKVDADDRLIAATTSAEIYVGDTSMAAFSSFQLQTSLVAFISFAHAATGVPSPPLVDLTPTPTPTPTPSHNIYVAVGTISGGIANPEQQNLVREFTPDGNLIRSIPFKYNGGSYGGSEWLRDIAVDLSGNIFAYNGTFAPYLTKYSQSTKSFSDRTYPGWSYERYLQGGSLALFASYAFACDLDSSVDDPAGKPSGIVRFDLSTQTASRFADGIDMWELNVGLDGRLYGLYSDIYGHWFVNEYDPSTAQLLTTVAVPADIGGNDPPGAIAVDAAGKIYLAGHYGAIYRLDPSGNLEASLATGFPAITDIEIDETGRIVATTSEGYALIGYSKLDAPFSYLAAISDPNVIGWTMNVALGPLSGGSSSGVGPVVRVTGGYPATEGVDATFSISLSTAATVPLTIGFTLAGTAHEGSDYTLDGSTKEVHIASGMSSATVFAHTIPDHIKEKKETITLTVSPGIGYTLLKKGSKGSTAILNGP